MCIIHKRDPTLQLKEHPTKDPTSHQNHTGYTIKEKPKENLNHAGLPVMNQQSPKSTIPEINNPSNQ
jgi:hypothetical protein